jgi:N-acetylmuramoyl-L-alanine amidase
MGLKIALDAGHGWENRQSNSYDSGAVGGGIHEADIALAWALTGKWVLENAGIPVFLTRDSDTDSAPLGSRDELAKAAGCTHFLSLHCNAAGATVRGTETIYRDQGDMKFAAMVQAAALDALGTRDRKIKQESSIIRDDRPLRLSVLDFQGAACLFEIAFISNNADRLLMLSRANRIRFFERLVAYLSV